MSASPQQIVVRALGTVALAIGFVVLVGRTPFVPESDTPSARPAAASRTPAAGPSPALSRLEAPELLLPNLRFETGALPAEAPNWLRGEGELAIPVTSAGPAAVRPSFGLFKATFNRTIDNPGFQTAEERVHGACAGAGERFAAEVCPDCQVWSGERQPGQPPMLMWSQFEDDESVFRAVTADCIGVANDGIPVVGTLRFGSDPIDLSSAGRDLALDTVPLVPGATRLAAVEEGGWLAIFDDVGRPSTALSSMATQLRNRGWRDAPGKAAMDYGEFEGQRVFTNDSNAVCVIALTKRGDTHQLLTVMDSRSGG